MQWSALFSLIVTSPFLFTKGLSPDTCSTQACLISSLAQGTKLVARDLHSKHYNQLNKQWNLRLTKVYPIAFFLPESSKDVAVAVKCGVASLIQLIPISGGHSFEGIAFGTGDQIVVDFRHMNKIRVEIENGQGIAYLEPGGSIGQITAHLWEHGGYGLSMGSCLTIGIGGYVIGGGLGYYSGVYGLAVDNLLHVEMVDAEGNIVQVNAGEHPDLFWALRGSGAGYIGIVTQYKMKLFEAARTKMTFITIHCSVSDFATGYIAMQNMQNWMHRTNRAAGLFGFTLTSDRYNQTLPTLPPGFNIAFLHIQDPTVNPEPVDETLKAVQEYFPAPASISVTPVTYLQHLGATAFAPVILPHPLKNFEMAEIGSASNYYGENPVMNEEKILKFLKLISKEHEAQRYFKAKCFFSMKHVSYEELHEVQKVVDRIPDGNVWILGIVWNGAIMKVARNATAYVHRDATVEFNMHYEGSAEPEYAQPGLKFLYDLRSAMGFMDGGETYQNGHDLEEHDYLDRYYKENLGRLRTIKGKWDPNNYFVSKLSIPPSVPNV